MSGRRDPFLDAAIEQARKSLSEGGIPIGSVLVHDGKIIEFRSEPGSRLTTVVEPGAAASPLVIVLNCEGGAKASSSEVAGKARAAGFLVTPMGAEGARKRWDEDDRAMYPVFLEAGLVKTRQKK